MRHVCALRFGLIAATPVRFDEEREREISNIFSLNPYTGTHQSDAD